MIVVEFKIGVVDPDKIPVGSVAAICGRIFCGDVDVVDVADEGVTDLLIDEFKSISG